VALKLFGKIIKLINNNISGGAQLYHLIVKIIKKTDFDNNNLIDS
jgi:hypothetical protein